VAVACLWVSSAIYGYSKTSECEEAIEEYDSRPVRPVRYLVVLGGPPAGRMPPPAPAPYDAPPPRPPGVPPAGAAPTLPPPVAARAPAPPQAPQAPPVQQHPDDENP
jgi:hypothetical protein